MTFNENRHTVALGPEFFSLSNTQGACSRPACSQPCRQRSGYSPAVWHSEVFLQALPFSDLPGMQKALAIYSIILEHPVVAPTQTQAGSSENNNQDLLPLPSESSLLLGRRPRFMISPGDSRQPAKQ